MNRRNWLKKSATGTASLALSSYVPYVIYNQRHRFPTKGDYLRLNWNENPYGPSPEGMAVVQEMLHEANYYPDDKIEALVESLSQKYGLSRHEVMITAGSTEVLSLLGQMVGLKKREILMSEQSFPTIAIFGERSGASIRMIPVDQQERIDLAGILASITDQTFLIFICNPNNPTSTDLAHQDITAFVRAVPKEITICIDEAYIQYSRDGEQGSLIHLLPAHKNLIICRTFSKAYGLAGMRIGFAMGSEALIHELGAHHPGFGMANSRLAVAAAQAALNDEFHLNMVIQKNEIGRQIVYNAFDKWNVHTAHSATNFIYAKSNRFVPDVKKRLEKEKILITKWPGMSDHIRISIGRPEWMERFVVAVEKYLI